MIILLLLFRQSEICMCYFAIFGLLFIVYLFIIILCSDIDEHFQHYNVIADNLWQRHLYRGL